MGVDIHPRIDYSAFVAHEHLGFVTRHCMAVQGRVRTVGVGLTAGNDRAVPVAQTVEWRLSAPGRGFDSRQAPMNVRAMI